MELKITKERILELAKQRTAYKFFLMELFPEVFEPGGITIDKLKLLDFNGYILLEVKNSSRGSLLNIDKQTGRIMLHRRIDKSIGFDLDEEGRLKVEE